MLSKCLLFLFVILFVLQFTHEQKMFRVDYKYINETSSHYKIHTLPRTWNEAKAVCQQEGAMLFYPDDENEALAVIDHWSKTQPFIRDVFVGLTKRDVESNAGRRVLTWHKGEPNNAGGNERCLVLKDKGTLNDEKCNSNYPFICKKPANASWNKECHLPDLDYEFSKVTKRCYKFHSIPKNWTEAYAICYREQSYLTVIDTDAEAAYLVDFIFHIQKRFSIPMPEFTDNVHLGFFNRDGWITRTGLPLHESYYNKWGQSQPDGGISEECGAMAYDGLLHDIPCYQEAFFICEHEVPLLFSDITLKNAVN